MSSFGLRVVGFLFAVLVLQGLYERGSGQPADTPEGSGRPAATATQPKAKPRPAAPARPAGNAGRGGATKRCPVAGPVSFINSWRAPRTGHRHQGTDMMAAQGTKLVAVEAGRIGPRIGPLGISGKRLWVYGNSGARYFYAHLSRIDVHAGETVRRGEQVGLVGATGNAAGGAPHLHFEVHPGGGSAVNPYPSLRRWCG